MVIPAYLKQSINLKHSLLIYRYISAESRRNLNNYMRDRNIGNGTFISTETPLKSYSGKMDYSGGIRQ